MRAENQIRLESKRRDIKNSLVLKDVAAFLLRDEVIDAHEYQQLAKLPSHEARADSLIDLLLQKEDDAFDSFLQALQQDYPWLADGLRDLPVTSEDITDFHAPVDDNQNLRSPTTLSITRSRPSASSRPCKKGKIEITSDVISIVRKNHRVVRNWTALAHRLGLTRQAQSIRVRVNLHMEDLDTSIIYLLEEWKGLKPADAHVESLVKILRAEDFNDVADELEDKYCRTN